MTKKFMTSFGDSYKVSFNFRENSLRVWELLRSRKWYKSFLVSGLTDKEMNEIAFNYSGDQFRTFLIENKKVSLWRF